MVGSGTKPGIGESWAGRHKRSDLIADEIKRWVIAEGKQPGDRLPQEKELAALFQCAKGTVREALKSLEVQGLISVRTGPNGGPTLVEVSYQRATELLRNYLHFQKMSIRDVYALRKVVEVELAASIVGRLSEKDLDLLAANVGCCAAVEQKGGEQETIRQLELDFHVLLARACPNPLLAFHSRFINDLLRDFIRFRSQPPDRHLEFARSNNAFHRDLIAAYRAEDRDAVRRIMTAHLEEAERFTLALDGVLSDDLFFSSPATPRSIAARR